jgi:hypothetical protein
VILTKHYSGQAAECGVTANNLIGIIVKYILIFLALFVGTSNAAEEVSPVDISKCKGFDCTTVWKGTYKLEPGIEVKAWFDAVDASNSGSLYFFPLFSIKNESGAPIKLKLGMQLLDSGNNVVAEASDNVKFAPYHVGVSDQDRFVSMNAVILTEKSTSAVKFVKVTYEQIW